ncbi:Hydrolase family protein / HAD-superfamily protein [Hirschfeldia incana]|nr:Hydrolase family protein / HAD-superfamily protein [Hirschfeldia incana]
MNNLRIIARNSLRRREFTLRSPSRSFCNLSREESNRPSYGIAFDIDGVILLGSSPVGGSPGALRRLFDDSGAVKIPFLFLTNGGGLPEAKRASEMTHLLGVPVSPLQMVQAHSPFRKLANRFGNELVVAAGKGEPAAVMSNYGFKNVISLDEYASYFDNIDPLAPYKKWITGQDKETSTRSRANVVSERVQAAFIVSDPVDWSRDIQVLCDILRTGGLPGKEIGPQPHLYFANDDLDYQTKFPTERLGMGAFRIALESIFNRVHDNPLEYTAFGKPNPSVFKNAEDVLKEIATSTHSNSNQGSHHFKTLYMVGDNPKIDIRGARQAGSPWFSILTRTGVFKGKDNHPEFPADLVVDTVEEAVDFILKRESAKLSLI